MKKITFLTLFMYCTFGFSQNQTNGTINSPLITPASSALSTIATERFRFGTGLVTQLDSGIDFDFTPSSQWLSFGRLTSPNQTLYGYRAQRAGRGLIFGFTGASQTASPTLGTPVIEWVGNGTATAGDLLFRTSPSSTSTISTQVMKMRADATSVLGQTSFYEDGTYVNDFLSNGFAPIANTNVEINRTGNNIEPGLSIFKKGIYSGTFFQSYAASFYNLNQNNTGGGGTTNGLIAMAISPTSVAVGLNAAARTTLNTGQTFGLIASGRGGFDNTGLQATSQITSGANNAQSYGIRTETNAFSASTTLAKCYGIFSRSDGNNVNGSLSYAIYGTGQGTNFFAGYFNGRIFSTNALVVSDKTLKKDIKNEENATEKLSKIKPVTYNFIQDKKITGLNLSDRLQHGFIAQELEEVFPELVEEILNPIFNEKNEQIGTKTLKAVNYIGLISVLTSSINELNKKIESLEEKLNEKNSTLIVNNARLSNDELLNIEKSSYSLGQNIPNPFKDKTTINYSLPESERNAKILILNLNGQLIKEYQLSETKGQLTIEAGTLQKGMYLYTLLSNNEEIITKKMIVN
jgi:hypothetical protein